MLSLAVDLALFKRLTGHPLDEEGRPVLDPDTRIPVNRSLIGPFYTRGELQPSYGVRIPVAKESDVNFDLSSTNPDALKIYEAGFHKDVFRQVPVFWQATEGREWESTFPCVTFAQTGERQADLYCFDGTDEFADPLAGTAVDEYGNVGPKGMRVSPNAELNIFTYAIRIQARNRIELSLMDTQIKRLFPQKTALLVERADGTTDPFDMIRYSVDSLTPGGTEMEKALIGDQRYYSMVYNYTIEAYEDTTVRGFGDQFSQDLQTTLLERVMEMVNFQTQNVVSTVTSTAVSVP